MCAMTMKLELGGSKGQLIHIPQHSGNSLLGWRISSNLLNQMASILRWRQMIQMEALRNKQRFKERKRHHGLPCTAQVGYGVRKLQVFSLAKVSKR